MTSKKYQKMDQREHVLNRSGMYIGSTEVDMFETWICDDNNQFIKKNIKYVSGLYKIFDEIIVNSLDHIVRLKQEFASENSNVKHVKEIKVNIDKQSGEIMVYNDGNGIDVYKHDDHHIWIPELIFGNLLTSTNYDDTTERIIGGTNGIGSKATNIYSSSFSIETVDHNRKLLYKQTFSNNMSIKTEPIITKYSKYPYTKITFIPDYTRFNMATLTDDMYNLMKKRVFDMCATTPEDIKIYLNDKKIECKNFEKYSNLYISDLDEQVKSDKSNERWEICASYSENGYNQVSFVNGVCTLKGGKHVEYITNQICKKMVDVILKKKKITVKPMHIKDNLNVFIKSTISNPTFDSQTKDCLTTPYAKFGSKVDLDAKFIEKLYKSNIVQRVIDLNSLDEDKTSKKTDGKKKSTVRGINKLDDANWAGTSKSAKCILILTEGDSAKTMAVSGLSIVGRNEYGIFPLKGKILNCKDVSSKKISENEEINNLKKIMGLETGKVYNSVSDLRYGKIMLMTDSDVDGSHIKGLLFNVFHTLWPSLLKIDGFLSSMLTPIVKASKGSICKEFYNLTDYENWCASHNNQSSWSVKYFKGLGTSTSSEAKQYFKNMNVVDYTNLNSKNTDNSLDLAFNKKRSDDRKDWISKYDRQNVLHFENKLTKVSYTEFIEKDLIHFSVYNGDRAIPSICDGLKKSTRKIMHCCFKRKLSKDLKVAQLSGYVSEHGAYHHGENSLQEAIIGLAQNFVGSNNINLLTPSGQFGTRIQGGKDSASPRYIYTKLEPITEYLFNKDDFDVYTYLNDDGFLIEPEWFAPILPTILVNGSIGIGTGYSTNIPSFNPLDIIRNIKLLLDDEDSQLPELYPWFSGYKGSIVDGMSKGILTKISTYKVRLTELPIGIWTEDFKNTLENFIENNPKIIKDYENHYTENLVDFTLTFSSSICLDEYMTINNKGITKLEQELKLFSTRPLNMSNMHLYDSHGHIKKYESPNHILKEYFNVRLDLYSKRKEFKLNKIKQDLVIMNAKIQFILAIIDEQLQILNIKKNVIEQYLTDNDFPLMDDKFDYLTKMPINNLTFEKKESLLEECSKKQSEYDTLFDTSHKQLWINDIESFEKFYTP